MICHKGKTFCASSGTCYVVEALRYGDRERHSYVVGLFKVKADAQKAAEAEKCWRGGKYDCEITEILIDSFPEEKLAHLEECS